MVPAGIHFIQDDSPNEIGEATAAWLPSLVQLWVCHND
jgi:hypothetical protein